MNQAVVEFIEHLSEKPWSEYTRADYTLEQWHASCLIHQHDGPPTSKSQCKLPVKTPSGVINRNGVHAAAAALAGARGGVNASSEAKSSASKSLARMYRQMDEEPPPSLLKHSEVLDFIEHHGVKGMRWGVRRNRKGDVTVGTQEGGKRATERTVYSKAPSKLTSSQLEQRIKRMETEKRYNDLNKRDVSAGEKLAAEIITNSGRAIATTVLTGAGLLAVKAVVTKKFGTAAGAMVTKRK